MTYSKSLLAVAMLFALAVPARAQVNEVRVEGRVADEQTGEAIPGVDLVVRAPGGRFIRSLVSDDSGKFAFKVRNLQAIRLYASRIGYEDNYTPLLYFDDHDFYEVELRLDPDVILLAPLEVIARREEGLSPVLADFEMRRQKGQGYYFTREEIERIKPALVSDLLARVPGVRLGSSGSGLRRTVSMGRGVGRNCLPQVYVDGLLVTKQLAGGITEGLVVDEVVTPNSVEGIEVYRGLSTVPAAFMSPDAVCGVVAIWTRRGG